MKNLFAGIFIFCVLSAAGYWIKDMASLQTKSIGGDEETISTSLSGSRALQTPQTQAKPVRAAAVNDELSSVGIDEFMDQSEHMVIADPELRRYVQSSAELDSLVEKSLQEMKYEEMTEEYE